VIRGFLRAHRRKRVDSSGVSNPQGDIDRIYTKASEVVSFVSYGTLLGTVLLVLRSPLRFLLPLNLD
jgi:hypothetical protein